MYKEEIANQAEYKEGMKLAEDLCNFVNRMGGREREKGFIDGMSRQHRTLQQSAFQLVLRWIYSVAKYGSFDLRNEHTVKTCRKIKELLGEYGDNCPFI